MPANQYYAKKIFFILFFLLPASASASIWTYGQVPEDMAADSSTVGFYDERSAQNIVWEDKLRRKVEFFCDTICEGRATGTRGSAEAAFYITRAYRKAGLKMFGDSYVRAFYTPDSARTGHNIIGMIPGSVRRPSSSYIIVGAHYDHLGILGGKMYPGADNNASGLVAMLSLAEMFSSMKTLGKVYGSSIIFVAFDGKELSMSGADALWKMLADGSLKDPVTGKAVTRENVTMMVNIDQIGSDWLSLCNRFYGANLEISESYYGSENFTKLFYRLSDQRPFVDNGIPAILFSSGITMNNNKTYDSPHTLDYPVFRRRIILIYHWIDKML